MKKLTTLLILLLCATALLAQSPEKFSYQAVVRNASNALVINAPVGVRVSILQGGVSGTLVYMETQTAVTNANGLITLQIGGGNVQQGVFSDIDWASGPYFLKTETDPDGGSNYSITSTQQLLSVPYALYAKDAGNGFSGDYNDLTNTPTIPTVPTNVSAFTNDAGYITMDSVPAIPTNISTFTNDAGYLTSYVETDPNVPAWAKEVTKPTYDYSEIANTPMIPTVPTNVSAFVNDVPYLTSFTEQQVLSISNDTIFLTGGSFVKLPEDFSGDYNDLTNKPEIPEIPEIPTVPDSISAFTNDVGYITMDSVPTIPVEVSAFNNDAQYVSNAECADVDLCALANALSQLQAIVEEQQSRIEELETLIGAADTTTTPIDTTTVTPTDTTIVTGGIPCPGNATVTDFDGNVYNTVQIGNQCWMKENLRTTRYPDGTIIDLGSTVYATTAYRFAPNNDANNVHTYGYLYNWKAVMHNSISSQSNPSGVQGICPTGWHVPSDAEWIELEDYMKGQSQYICGNNTGSIAKALASNIGWTITTTDACEVGSTQSSNNASGFGALPAGGYSNNDYVNFGVIAHFWSATKNSSDLVYERYLSSFHSHVVRIDNYKGNGYSVRCLRDENGGGTAQMQPTVITGEATDITSSSATLHGTVSNPDNVTITAQGFLWKASQGGTYTTVNATGTTMSYNLTGLTANTGYTYRAFVTTAQGISYGAEVSFTTPNSSVVIDSKSCPDSPTVTDHEGNVYATVQIGDQCWTRENLRTTTSPSTGTYLIPAANADYTYTGKQARWYNNDSATYAPMNYGLLYNWNAAVDTFNTAYGETSVNTDYYNAVSVTFTGHRRGICPAGWHLPSDEEWTAMTNYVSSQSEYTCGGISDYINKALASETGWNSYSGECSPADQSVYANNATGFSAVPAGACYGSSFYYAGYSAAFWSSTQYNSDYAYRRVLSYYYANVYRDGYGKYDRFSVRCLRD